MRHKHADLICAWAKGAQIEYFSDVMNNWRDVCSRVQWIDDVEYRIKPEPKPDVEALYYASIYSVSPAVHFNRTPNLKLTFDVETCELKSAEVLK
jgi:hypothetical protein